MATNLVESEEQEEEIKQLEAKLFASYYLKKSCKSCKKEVKDDCCPFDEEHEVNWIKEKDGKSIVVRVSTIRGVRGEIQLCSLKRHTNPKGWISCPLAHGNLELYLWKDMKLIRDAVYSPREEPLKPELAPVMCDNMTRRGKCKHQQDCIWPHSQAELKLWSDKYKKESTKYAATIKEMKDKLFHTHKLQEICAVCYQEKSMVELISNSTCPHSKDEEWKRALVYPALVRPLPTHSTMELCAFNMDCKNGEKCTRSHSEFELRVWEDMKEIERAIREPRKEPPEFRSIQMCKSMEKEGRCTFRTSCKFAHSQAEAELWGKTIEEIKELISTLMSSKSIETLTLVHENTSEKSLRLALDLLIALETEEANGNKDINTMDRSANVIEAMKFLNCLAKPLNQIVFNIDELKEQFEEDSNEEYQEMDHRKLLDVIRHKKEIFSDKSDIIYCYATLLVAISHRIAHQCYLIESKSDSPDEVLNPSLVGTEGFIITLFRYGIDAVQCLADNTKLSNIKEELKDYIRQLAAIQAGFKPAVIVIQD